MSRRKPNPSDMPVVEVTGGKPRVVKVPDWAKAHMPVTPRPEKKEVSLSTLDRRMQIIAKWERLRYITTAKAKQLRDRVLEEINQ